MSPAFSQPTSYSGILEMLLLIFYHGERFDSRGGGGETVPAVARGRQTPVFKRCM